MNDAVLEGFRRIADAMEPDPQDWQWIGKHMSQRMFGITEVRAITYAAIYGGVASRVSTDDMEYKREPVAWAAYSQKGVLVTILTNPTSPTFKHRSKTCDMVPLGPITEKS